MTAFQPPVRFGLLDVQGYKIVEFNDDENCVEEVNKAEDDVWIVFPWEQWWGINYEEKI